MKLSTKEGVSHHFGGVQTSLTKYRAICGIAAIVSQYRAIWGHYDPENGRVVLRNPEKGAFARGALRKVVANCAPNLRKIAGSSFRTSSGTPRPVFTPMCVLGIAHVSGKAPLSGQGKRADTQCICPFRPKESVGRKGQIHCVSALFPCPERGALPDTWAIPKHTSG